jgi:branched-chain amino acid transport system permease protein
VNTLIDHLGQHTIDGLTKGAIYALVALGYTLVYGVLRLINFAHSEVFMVGTFTILVAFTIIDVNNYPALTVALPLALLALVLAGLVSGGVALTVERVAYRPLRRKNAPPLIFLITAIGLSLILVELFGFVLPKALGGVLPEVFGRPRAASLSIPYLFENKPIVTILGTTINSIHAIVIASAVVMMIGLDIFINRTRYGRAVRAVAQSPQTAALMGVNQDRVIMLIFALGGIMAGAAAVLWSIRIGNTSSTVGFVIGLKAFTAAVLGGIGNLRGALLGGLLLGIVEVYAATLMTSAWEDVFAFVVLVVVLMFRPTGLLGESLGKARA